MHRIRLPAIGALLLGGMSTALAAPIDAIRAGDMNQMIPEIIAIYEDAGLSWEHGIEWNIGPFTTTFWFYDPNEDVITAGAVPADDEIETYWQTWSEVLTDGNFEPDGFFASAAEARELAHYNQYVLATHESAHAITFRYDYGHLQRHDYDINCREYYADRLTVAILNNLAETEPDMARWRARYLELVTAMGETIPDQYRSHIADFATLDADCGVIEVAQPTPETMQPYASAYFERYRVLLEAELPPMAEVFKMHLSDVHAAAIASIPFESDGYELVTLADVEEFDLGRVYDLEHTDDEVLSRAAAFDPEGTLWFATLRYNRETRATQFAFGTDPMNSPPTGEPGVWSYPSVSLEISSLAVISADRFLFTLDHWDREGSDEAVENERHLVSFILAQRENDAWTLTSIAEVEGMQHGAMLRAPSGRLYMIATRDSTGAAKSWVGFEISLERADVVEELTITSGFDFPIAIDDDLRLYEELGMMLWGSTPEGSDGVVTGNGLMGPRDGIGIKAEVADIQVLQWMEGGRALLIDRGPSWDGMRLRELRPVE